MNLTFDHLPPEERLRLLEDIWDSIADVASVPVPPWHIAELDRRLDDPGGEATMSWDQIQPRLWKSK